MTACGELRKIWTLLALALTLALVALLAPAAGATPPETGLHFETSNGERLAAPVLETDVRLQVTGMIVRAHVTQRFANPHDQWMEGVYTFPLPESAAVDGLHMIVGDRIIEGQIHEKEDARQVYEEAKREGVKASLVEQQRPNLFTSRVANIGPGEEVEVELQYQQSLPWDAGSFRLRFPMTWTPRYEPAPDRPETPDGPRVPQVLPTAAATSWPPAQPAPGENGVSAHGAQEPACEDWEVEYRFPVPSGVRQAVLRTHRLLGAAVGLLQGPPRRINPSSLTVELDAGVPLASLDSSYHTIEVDAVDPVRGRYSVALAQDLVSADRDFELVWRPELGTEPHTALFTEESGLDTYALLMVLPPDAESSGFQRLPRETVFVLDVSGSMQGSSIREAKDSLLFALDRLAPEDSFNVLAFSDQTRALFPGSWPANPEVIERARGWVRGLRAGGGTEMMPALLAALDSRPEGYGQSGARAVKQVVFITDGAVGNEEQLFTAIEQHLGEARLFTVGIGSAPNSFFMQRAAELGRGSFTFIGEPQQVQDRMQELFAKIDTPALTGVEVHWDDPGAEMYPQRVPDLYAGEPVVVAAKLIRLGDEVRLIGERDGSWWDESLALRRLESAAASFGGVGPGGAGEEGPESGIGKLWARRKTTALLDQWRRTPDLAADSSPSVEKAELRRQVVELALDHHLVSKFTSLVAVDITPSRPDGAPLASQPVSNARPAGSTWDMAGFLPSGGTSAGLSLGLGLLLLALTLVLRRLLPATPERPARR